MVVLSKYVNGQRVTQPPLDGHVRFLYCRRKDLLAVGLTPSTIQETEEQYTKFDSFDISCYEQLILEQKRF